MKNREQNILANTLLQLEKALGEDFQLTYPDNLKLDQGYDAEFKLKGKTIYIEAKNEVRPHQVERHALQKDKFNHLLVVANYITPKAKELLKEKQINYVDRVGNIWFRLNDTFIYIEGIHNQPPTEDRKNRAFTRTGIKVVFQFLLDVDLINATYREIATKADVALGTIPKVIEGLKQEQFILKKTDKEWIVTDYQKLLNRWHVEYNRTLKPTLLFKRYRAVNPDFYRQWKKLELINGDQWGGEPAGDLLTNYLKPERFILYTEQTETTIMKEYRWIPDPDGDIEVYQKFWKAIEEQATNHTPDILVYADLIESGESRCLETANLIYEQLQKP